MGDFFNDFLINGLIFQGVLFLLMFIKWSFRKIQTWRRNRMLSRWSEISKRSGLLYVHCVPPAKIIPSASPFVLKVQTFLRFAGIPHELDHMDPMGGNGKTPWISLNGENVADSEFILEFLRKTYGDNLNSRYSSEEVAIAKSVRVMLEEHAVWGMFLERFVYGSRDKREQVFSMNIVKAWLIKKVMRTRGQNQGLGLHKEEDMIKLISADFKTVSLILGGRKFILGDQPCAEDAAIFGQLCQFYWGLPNSPYEALLNGECRNLRDYCYRIRETFWPEWK